MYFGNVYFDWFNRLDPDFSKTIINNLFTDQKPYFNIHNSVISPNFKMFRELNLCLDSFINWNFFHRHKVNVNFFYNIYIHNYNHFNQRIYYDSIKQVVSNKAYVDWYKHRLFYKINKIYDINDTIDIEWNISCTVQYKIWSIREEFFRLKEMNKTWFITSETEYFLDKQLANVKRFLLLKVE